MSIQIPRDKGSNDKSIIGEGSSSSAVSTPAPTSSRDPMPVSSSNYSSVGQGSSQPASNTHTHSSDSLSDYEKLEQSCMEDIQRGLMKGIRYLTLTHTLNPKCGWTAVPEDVSEWSWDNVLTAQEVLDFDLRDFVLLGVPDKVLLEHGPIDRWFRGKFTARQIANAKKSAKQRKEEGASCKLLVEEGYYSSELVLAGYTRSELLKGGVRGTKLRRVVGRSGCFLGITYRDAQERLRNGASIKQLIKEGYTVKDLRHKPDVTAKKLRDAGFTLAEQIASGAYDANNDDDIRELVDAGYWKSTWIELLLYGKTMDLGMNHCHIFEKKDYGTCDRFAKKYSLHYSFGQIVAKVLAKVLKWIGISLAAILFIPTLGFAGLMALFFCAVGKGVAATYYLQRRPLKFGQIDMNTISSFISQLSKNLEKPVSTSTSSSSTQPPSTLSEQASSVLPDDVSPDSQFSSPKTRPEPSPTNQRPPTINDFRSPNYRAVYDRFREQQKKKNT